MKGLPAEGTALARAVHGEKATWTTNEWLLASIADAVRSHAWAYQAAHVDKHHRPPPPAPIPFPGHEVQERREASHDETVAFFAAAIGGGGRG